jgi:hypothetical protein
MLVFWLPIIILEAMLEANSIKRRRSNGDRIGPLKLRSAICD